MLKIKVDEHGPYIKLHEFCGFIEHLSQEPDAGAPIDSWRLEERLRRKMRGHQNLPFEVPEALDEVYKICRRLTCSFCEDQDPNPECEQCWGEGFFDNRDTYDYILQRAQELNFNIDAAIRIVA